jgi:glucose/arabinose dehydrogenase
LDAAARSLPLVILTLAVIAAFGVGTVGALCRYRYNCHLHAGLGPARELRKLEQENRGSPQARLPPWLRETVVARGFELPTDFAFLPDGDVLVAEKSGLVYRVKPTGSRRIVLDLRSRVDTTDYRGLVTVAVSPAFATNRLIYVLYVVRPNHPGTTVERFSSFQLPPGARRADH